jgi:hypothetical protein
MPPEEDLSFREPQNGPLPAVPLVTQAEQAERDAAIVFMGKLQASKVSCFHLVTFQVANSNISSATVITSVAEGRGGCQQYQSERESSSSLQAMGGSLRQTS